jgi:photosystem II stability/assembly factor-like uncharacterized protein
VLARSAVVALFLCCTVAPARAEWVSAGGSEYIFRAVQKAPSGNWFAATGQGFLRSTDAGLSWTMLESELFADGFTLLIPPDSNQLFIAVESGVYRSDDDGESWTNLGEVVAGAYSLAFAPNRDLWASGSFGTKRSTDRGLSWTLVHEIPGGFTDGLAIDGAGRVYLRSQLSTLDRSDDLGTSWTPIDPDPEFKSGLAVSPRTGTLLASTQTVFTLSIYRSTDHGGSWQRVVHRAGSLDALFFLSDGNVLAGADSILFSNDDGLTWTVRHQGFMPGAQVTGFAEIDGQIFAASSSGGLWRETGLVVSVPPRETAAGRLRLSASPSPFVRQTTLRFAIPEPGRVRLDLFGLRGERVATVVDAELPAGTHSVACPVPQLAPGLYFARLAAGAERTTLPLVVLR